jgi:hypothetical protein
VKFYARIDIVECTNIETNVEASRLMAPILKTISSVDVGHITNTVVYLASDSSINQKAPMIKVVKPWDNVPFGKGGSFKIYSQDKHVCINQLQHDDIHIPLTLQFSMR